MPGGERRPPRRMLDRNVVTLGKAAFLHDVSSEMIFPFLPAFLTTVLGAPPILLGIIEGAADTVSSLLRPLFGALSDRVRRRKPFVVCGYGLANATRPLLAIVTGPWQVLAIRLSDRLGKAVRTAPRDALLADSSGAEDRGRAFGFHRAMDHAGAVVGPLAASLVFLALDRSYTGLFLVASVPGLLAVAYAALRVREREENLRPWAQGEERSFGRGAVGSLPPPFFGLVGAIFLFTLGNSSDAFLLLRLQEAGVDVALLPFLWAALHVVKTASVYPFGALSDRVGRRPMLLAGWGFYALTYAGFAFIDTPLGVSGLFVAYGIFHGLTEGAERALVGDLVDPERRGIAFGIYNGVVGLGALPASLIMGTIWQAHGASPAFLFGATMAALAAAALLALGLLRRE